MNYLIFCAGFLLGFFCAVILISLLCHLAARRRYSGYWPEKW